MCTEYQPGNLNHGGVYWAIKLTTHGDGGQTIWSDSRDNLRKIYSRIVQLSATNLGFLLHTLQCIFLAVHSALLASRRSYGMQWVLFLVTGVWRKRLWGVRCEDKIVELVSSVNQGGYDVWTGATGWLADCVKTLDIINLGSVGSDCQWHIVTLLPALSKSNTM